MNPAVEGFVVAVLGIVAAATWFVVLAAIADAVLARPVPPIIARAEASVDVDGWDDPNATEAFGVGTSQVVYYGVRRHGALTSMPEAWLLRDRVPTGGGR